MPRPLFTCSIPAPKPGQAIHSTREVYLGAELPEVSGAGETRPEVLEDLDDRDLVTRCQRELPHRVDSYRELLRRYESLVFNTCLKITGNPQEAEEACQDSFLQVFHKIHQFEGRSTFKTWLFRIVYNFCIARRKKMATRREREQLYSEEIQGRADTLDSAYLQMNLSEGVHEAIGRLKGEQRRIIILKFVTGLTLEEISRVLEIKLSATKMRLYRALEAFKQHYLDVTREEQEPGSAKEVQP